MTCELISSESHHRNIKSRTESESLALSENLIGTCSVGNERNRLKESAIAKRLSLIEE